MISEKLDRLRELIREMESVVVAYSGGVDSTLLLKLAYDELGERAVGVTADSPSLPRSELDEARTIADQIGCRHVLVKTGEMDDPSYLANTPERCYFCKSHLADVALDYARTNNFRYVVDGNNADDANDFRPGRRAARERGLRSPLQEAGVSKAEVRALARQFGLPNWDKPAAACLSSRIPYGTAITLQALSQVERAENYLRGLGLRQVRVRHHDLVARIETDPADFALVIAQADTIASTLRELGFTYVSLDLAGYRLGSANEVLPTRARQPGQ